MMGNTEFDYGVNTPDEFDENRGFMNSSARNSMGFPAPNSPGHSSSTSPCRFFEHPVSKLDTLAGVAIRYGVEVADIKRMNALITDRQMFGLKTLRIPQPGRHPPSPSLPNGCGGIGNSASAKTPPRRMLLDVLDSFESLNTAQEQKLCPTMSSMQGYYGAKSEGFEMAIYNKEMVVPIENEPSSASGMKPLLSFLGKSRSLANVFHFEEDEMGMSEVDLTSRIPGKILKESGISGWFSAIKQKQFGLALRTKASSKNNLDSEAEPNVMNTNASSLLASIIADGLLGVRKSSSTPIIKDEDNSSNISIWSGVWNLKTDLHALSNSSIAKPILECWSNPITGRKTKTAMD